jgi:hypothetical protein
MSETRKARRLFRPFRREKADSIRLAAQWRRNAGSRTHISRTWKGADNPDNQMLGAKHVKRKNEYLPQ